MSKRRRASRRGRQAKQSSAAVTGGGAPPLRRAWIGVAGIAVPGLPSGSPGMEGFTKDRYEVVSFTRTRTITLYAAR